MSLTHVEQLDASPEAHEKATIEIVGNILDAEKGVIIICIKMYERIDESTLATLAMLHQKYRLRIWKHVVIALTMADRYEEHKWLKSKGPKESKSKFLSDKFRKEITEREKQLKEYCIASNDNSLRSCYIGMTEAEFVGLRIQVLPTSQLEKHEMERMKQVDCGYWFDQLLIKCCQRVQGCGLIQVHEKRLMKLPNKLMEREVSGEMLDKVKKNKDVWEKLFCMIIPWYQEYAYFKSVSTKLRFEEKPEQTQNQE